jgi:molecular chaperone GrpE (heat shock protein)
LKRQQEKYESMMHSRARDYERKIEELEDKLNRSQDECDDYKRKYERVDKVS